MPTIEVITGAESWANHSAKLSCFFVNPDTFEEKPLNGYVRQLPGGSDCSLINSQTIQARPGMKAELGMWYRTNYMLPVRTLLKVYGQRHVAQGARDEKAIFYIRLRDDAAHRRMAMTLSRSMNTLAAAYIDGRFDVLSVETVEALGVNIAPHYMRFYEPRALSVFTETVLSPEVATQPMVRRVRIRNEQGKEVTFVRARSPRKLNLS